MTPVHSVWLLPVIRPGQLRELLRFLVIGGTSALLYAALGVFFTRIIGLRPSLAILATLALLIPPTYLAQRRVAFRSSRHHASAFPRYIGTQIAGNTLALIGSELFSAIIQQQPWLAFAMIAMTVAFTNYLLLKLWAFRPAL